MPVGSIVKTPNSGSTKDATTIKSKERNGSANVNASVTGSSGKKFVQTRLLFKILTPVAKSDNTADSEAAEASPISAAATGDDAAQTDRERGPRKRKLSYGCAEDAEADQLNRSDSKENLELSEIASSKKPKTMQAEVDEVIVLDDDEDAYDDDDDNDKNNDNNDDDAKDTDTPATPIEVKKPKGKSNAKTKANPNPKEKSSTGAPPIQIKLPLSSKGKKKRKSSLKKVEKLAEMPAVPADRSDSSDDIEEIAVELNPQKRPKVQETMTQTASKQATTPNEKRAKESQPDEGSDVVLAESTGAECNTVAECTTKQSEEVKRNDDEYRSDVDLVESSDCEPKSNSSDVDMEADTDTLQKTSPEKEPESETMPQRKSLQAVNDTGKKTTVTPKQQKLMEQRRKAREEKERKLAEERRQKQLEKEQREQQKKEQREQKEEQRRKEREDKDQQRRQEREEKERKRQAEVDTKNEEKRKRNEAKEEVQRKKDEEKRRKEQEKEEAEQKAKRAAATFSKFFVPKQTKQSTATAPVDLDQTSCDSSNGCSQSLAFRPFQVKDDMILAPVIRASIASDTRMQLDRLFRHPENSDDEDLNDSIGRVKPPTRSQLYLGELSLGRHKPQHSSRDERLQRRAKDDDEDDDVQVVDELGSAGMPIVEERPKQQPWMRAKYLHFADNRRPPYYGTWRKRSQFISARRPLGQDKGVFDYEVDSDCEWEEEEPGESLSASEDEKERESEEESEEEYNEWFVPHGHLSDEELQNDDELDDGHTREAQKAKLQVLQQEFAQEMKKQTKKIKPRLLGPVWLDENGNKSELFPAVFSQTIDMYGVWQLKPLTLEPLPEPLPEKEPQEENSVLQLDEQMIQQFVRLIHANRNNKPFLIAEYLEYLKKQLITSESQEQQQPQYQLPSKTFLREKFEEFAIWKPVESAIPGVGDARKSKKPKKLLCWIVNAEILQKYQLSELTLQNQWNYTLTPKINKLDVSVGESSPPDDQLGDSSGISSKSKTLINSFTSKRDESPATPATTTTSAASTTGSNTKKRATLLMSVPRDQQIPVTTKNALISQYLRKQQSPSNRSVSASSSTSSAVAKEQSKTSPTSRASVDDDVVLLSD